MWRAAARVAGIGNRLLTIIAGLLVFVMLAYGTYSLWDTYRVSRNAFVSAELLDYKPVGDGESAGFAELQELNPDVRAWITIPDTHIDYPVLQGENNMIYVNQDVYGEFSLSGAIFLASADSPDFLRQLQPALRSPYGKWRHVRRCGEIYRNSVFYRASGTASCICRIRN